MDNSGGFTPPPPPPPPPPGGPGGGGDVLQPRGLGDILSAAFEIYTENAAKLITIVAVIVVPLELLLHLITGVIFAAKKSTIAGTNITLITKRSASVGFLASAISVLILVVISSALQAAITRASAQSTVGDPVDVGASYQFGFRKFGPVLVTSFVVALAVGIGFILLFVPGVFFMGMFAVAIPVVVIEGKGVGAALSRSWELVKGNFWHALGTVVVAFLIASVISAILGVFAGSNWFLGWIFGSIAAIITTPFTAMVTVLLYLDLRTRAENLTSSQLKSELAQT